VRDVLPTLLRWREEGHRYALATVIHTWGSSPRPVGASMGIRDDGAVVGSVSGGCVENAVTEAGLTSLGSGAPIMLEFGALSDAAVWEVGLSCGGRIKVWVDPEPYLRTTWTDAAQRVQNNQPCMLVTQFEPFNQELRAPDRKLSDEVDGTFFQVLPCRERLIIIGASHIAIPLVQFASALGLETVVIDPRPALTAPERFTVAPDHLLSGWPHHKLPDLGLDAETYVVTLSHDPKIDDVALEILLKSPVAYIGALGSRTTQAARRAKFLSAGFTDEQVGRIHGPVGLAIGAKSPEEIALSIVAEIVQVRNANR